MVCWEKLEKSTNQIRERPRVGIFQTGSRQETCANYLQAIPAGFLSAQHQRSCFHSPLDHWQLALPMASPGAFQS